MPASRARSKTRRASSSEDVTPFMNVGDTPNVIAPSESALTRNPEVPSLRDSIDRTPEANCRRKRALSLRPGQPLGSNDLRCQKVLYTDWQLPHAHAGGVVDGGGDRRSDPCQADLTNAAGAQIVQVQVRMLQEDDLVRRRIRMGGENIVRKVAVDWRTTARVVRDLLEQRHADPHGDGAFDLIASG